MAFRRRSALGLASLASFAAASQCPARDDTIIIQPIQVVIEKPYHVSAYVEQNGVFAVADGLTVNVDNAPTTLVTELTQTSTLCTTVEETPSCEAEDSAAALKSPGVLGSVDLSDYGCPVPSDDEPTVTVEARGAVQTPVTVTIPEPDGEAPETVVVLTPSGAPNAAAAGDGSFTTITRALPPGSPPSTVTLAPANPGDPTTVVVSTPAEEGFTTVTRPLPPGSPPVTVTYPPGSPNDPATVVVSEPIEPGPTTTLTRPLPPGSTSPVTVTYPPENPGDPVTVIVSTPVGSRTTINRPLPPGSTAPVTVTLPPDSPNDPTTVIVSTPVAEGGYTTETRPLPPGYTAPVTVTLPPDNPGDPTTVIVSTPINQPRTTITRPLPPGVTQPVTITETPDNPGDPTTVIVSTPVIEGGYTTETRPLPPGFTTPVTITLPPDNPGDPTTVIVSTPVTEGGYTTETRPLPPGFTTPVTVTLTPDNPGDPTTVIVSTPVDETSPTVVSTPAVEVPTTTVTRPLPPGSTTPVTVTLPPGEPGDPVTVIVSTPVEAPSTNPTPIPTTTPLPSTISATPIPTQTPDRTCDNAGLEYAIIRHYFVNAGDDASFFSRNRPVYTGVTNMIGIEANDRATDPERWADPIAIYNNGPERSVQWTALNHQGYLYAPVTGQYTVYIPISDDVTMIWFGDKALEGYTSDNVDLRQDYIYGGGTNPLTLSIPLEEGTYTPMRVLWGNGPEQYQFVLRIESPSGETIVDETGSGTDYLVRAACDQDLPAFAPWGTEDIINDESQFPPPEVS